MRSFLCVVIVALLAINVFLFQENRKLAGQLDQLRSVAKETEKKNNQVEKNLEILNLFNKAISGKGEFQSLDEFGKKISENDDSEIMNRFQDMSRSQSAEKLFDFSDFILNKSIEEIKK